jgi:hypothetical protein
MQYALVFAVIMAACGGTQATRPLDQRSPPVERAQTIGRAIYNDDDASARATDAMIAAHLLSESVIGWSHSRAAAIATT